MMNPFSISVAGVEYKILEMPTEENCGITQFSRAEIHINPNLSDDMRRSTLLHEVMHACANVVGIEAKTKISEEEWINRISTVLLDTLKSNAQLITELDICK